MESQPQNPEFRINSENIHPHVLSIKILCAGPYETICAAPAKHVLLLPFKY